MDASQGRNPYLGLEQNELNKKLQRAVYNNELTTVSLLIEANADVNLQEPVPLLIYAVFSDQFEMAELLINNKAVVNLSYLWQGQTVFDYAVNKTNLKLLDLLIRKKEEQMQELPKGSQKKEEQNQFRREIEKTLKYFINYKKKYIPTYCGPDWQSVLNKEKEIMFRLFSTGASHEDPFKKAEYYEALKQAQSKVYKVMVPAFLNKHPRSFFHILPLELIDYIRDFQLQLEFSSSPAWYQHRFKSDFDNKLAIKYCMNVNKYFLPIKKIEAADFAKILTHAPTPVITLLQDSKKRKTENKLDENGRNKRMRTDGINDENNVEQEMNIEQHNHYSSVGLGANK